MEQKTWKPIAGGVCSIVGGSLSLMGAAMMGVIGMLGYAGISGMWGMWGMWGPEFHMMPWGAGLMALWWVPALILGVVAIVGGVLALKRRHWGWSLTGAICATLTPMSFVLGVLAIVFIAISRDEFQA